MDQKTIDAIMDAFQVEINYFMYYFGILTCAILLYFLVKTLVVYRKEIFIKKDKKTKVSFKKFFGYLWPQIKYIVFGLLIIVLSGIIVNCLISFYSGASNEAFHNSIIDDSTSTALYTTTLQNHPLLFAYYTIRKYVGISWILVLLLVGIFTEISSLDKWYLNIAKILVVMIIFSALIVFAMDTVIQVLVRQVVPTI